MPKTLDATRSPVWADSVAVDVRRWIWVIKPICPVSLGRKYDGGFSFNHSESPFQKSINKAVSDCVKLFHTRYVSLKFETDNFTV
jgi:hypothetical protein